MAKQAAPSLMHSGTSAINILTSMWLLSVSNAMLHCISIEHLKQQVKSCLPDLTPVPSGEWLRLQFWPCDPYTSRAMHHTGCSNIKFQVQSRLVRADHADSKYAAVQYKYLKNFVLKFQEHCLMISIDDKANVPVAEPGKPQATGVWGHNHSLPPVSGPISSALHHDFHLAGNSIHCFCSPHTK